MRSLLAVAALVALGGCSSSGFEDAEGTVRKRLRDPSSAEFRDVARCSSGTGVQGEVNGANAFGGKTGFQPFIVVGQDVAIGFAAENMTRLQKVCYGSGYDTGNDISADPVAK